MHAGQGLQSSLETQTAQTYFGQFFLVLQIKLEHKSSGEGAGLADQKIASAASLASIFLLLLCDRSRLPGAGEHCWTKVHHVYVWLCILLPKKTQYVQGVEAERQLRARVLRLQHLRRCKISFFSSELSKPQITPIDAESLSCQRHPCLKHWRSEEVNMQLF